MKRLLSLAAMLLVCCVTLFAQQALWGGAAVVSPDIHDDNTVTFRLKAPKAVRVQITGDLSGISQVCVMGVFVETGILFSYAYITERFPTSPWILKLEGAVLD